MTIVENVATRRQVKPLIMLLADVSVTIWLVLFSILKKTEIKRAASKIALKLYNVNRVYVILLLVCGYCSDTFC